MTLNLRALMREVIIDLDTVDPTEVADETLRRLRKADYAEALRQTLRQLSRLVVQGLRADGEEEAEEPKSATRSGKGRSSHKFHRTHTALAGLRAAYSTATGWKKIQDMTHDDLLYAAEQRDDIATANTKEAEKLRGLALHVTDTVAHYLKELEQS